MSSNAEQLSAAPHRQRPDAMRPDPWGSVLDELDTLREQVAKLREAAQGEYLARGSGDVEPLGPWIDNIIGDTASSGEGKE